MDFEKILLKRFSRNFWCTLNLHRNARLVGAFFRCRADKEKVWKGETKIEERQPGS